jgi:peptidoglycan/LPS O-acetylase OafA/YrhL
MFLIGPDNEYRRTPAAAGPSLSLLRRALNWLAANLEPPAAAGRIRSVEGTRALAAIVVFLSHLNILQALGSLPGSSAIGGLGPHLNRLGPLGTDCFLVISGCFVYRSLMRSQNGYGSFLRRRVLRIYPLFLVVLAAYVVLYAALLRPLPLPADPFHAGAHVLANVALLAGLFPIQPIVPVSWTLSYIFAFYLASPLLVRGARLGRLPRARRAAVLLVLAVCGAGLAVVDPMRARVSMFFVGMLVWEAIDWFGDGRRGANWLPQAALAVAVLTLAAFGVSIFPDWLVPHRGAAGLGAVGGGLTVGAGLFCFCFCAFGGHAGLSRLLACRPLRLLGGMSYSIFLTHALVFSGCSYLARYLSPRVVHPALTWVWVPACIAASLAVATGFFLLLERRFIPTARLQSPKRLLTDQLQRAAKQEFKFVPDAGGLCLSDGRFGGRAGAA